MVSVWLPTSPSLTHWGSPATWSLSDNIVVEQQKLLNCTHWYPSPRKLGDQLTTADLISERHWKAHFPSARRPSRECLSVPASVGPPGTIQCCRCRRHFRPHTHSEWVPAIIVVIVIKFFDESCQMRCRQTVRFEMDKQSDNYSQTCRECLGVSNLRIQWL